MAEPECAEQRAARALLSDFREEHTRLRAAQAQGTGPPTNEALETEFARTMARLEVDAARPASERLPVNAVPPRDVLSALGGALYLEEPPSSGSLASSVVSRVIGDDEEARMLIGVNLRTLPAGASLSTMHSAPTVRLAMIPWRAEMGSWPPLKWAWFLLLLYRKGGVRVPLSSVRLSFKLQDRPTPDFREEVAVAWRDVCRTQRMAGEASFYADASFTTGPVVRLRGTLSERERRSRSACRTWTSRTTWLISLTRRCGASLSSSALKWRTGRMRPPSSIK